MIIHDQKPESNQSKLNANFLRISKILILELITSAIILAIC